MNTFPHLVMVYGTLQKGHGNNSIMTGHKGENARLLGKATTLQKFYMAGGGFPRVSKLVLGDFPASQKRIDFYGQIKGEVWMIDNVALKACDKLEGHPRWYCREVVPVTLMDKGRTRLRPWMYIMTEPFRSYECLEKDAGGVLEWKSANWATAT